MVVAPTLLLAQSQMQMQTIEHWQMQDSAKVKAAGPVVSTTGFQPQGWYAATVPGTVLTTLVNNGVYPDPVYGENMRAIPESLNKTSYWYRTTFKVPALNKGRHTWLHFGGINYTAEIWVNGQHAGSMRGAFLRGDFDISEMVKPGRSAVLAVLVAPQPHPGIPHEHTVALRSGYRMVARRPSTVRHFFPPSAGTGCPRFAIGTRGYGFQSRWMQPGRSW